MSLDILFELAWKSAICAGLTLLLLALLKRRSAAERSRVAHAGLLAVLMLPVAIFAVPDFEVQAPAQITHLAQSRLNTGDASKSPIPNVATPGAIPRETPEAAPPIARETVEQLLIAIPAALLLMMTLIAVGRLHLLRSRSRVLRDARWLTALAAMQDRFGFKHGTALLVSDELSSPVSWGVMRPVILLDEHAAADSRQAEAIIAHELAHVARFDWAKLILGRAATALFWFNPSSGCSPAAAMSCARRPPTTRSSARTSATQTMRSCWSASRGTRIGGCC